MKTMKTLSIIIPVYNTGQYLRQCLDSVIIDNSFNGEIVCVNDGSTDDSQEILMQYAEQYHNIVVLTQKNGGLSNARNSGLSAAKGEYVMFVDSDDMLAPGAVDAIMASVTNEDIFYVDVKIFNEDSGFYEPEEHRTPVRQVPGRDYYATYPVSDPPLYCVCVWGGGYRRAFLLQHKLWQQAGIYHEDELFTPKALFFAESVSTIPFTAYIYRRRGGSITSHITPKHCKDHLTVADELYDFFNQQHWLTAASKQSIWNNYYYALSKSLKCSLKRSRFWSFRAWRRMLQCSFTRRYRRTAVLALFSFSAAIRYYSYSIPRWQRKLINLFIR